MAHPGHGKSRDDYFYSCASVFSDHLLSTMLYQSLGTMIGAGEKSKIHKP